MDGDLATRLDQIEADLNYLIPMAEKPYAYAYETPAGRPQRNGQYAERRVTVRNGRKLADAPTLDGEGFAFQPRVERVVGPDGLHELLAVSDFVVLAAPLTAETEGLIDEAALGAMKRDAWLINVARGRLVDDRALIRALRDGRIGGAALDTFSDEPLPISSPYWELSNVIVTPHTAWSSTRVLDRSIELFCDNLGRFSRGEPLRNVVDPTAGY